MPKTRTTLELDRVSAAYKRGKATDLQLWEAMHATIADNPQSRTRKVLEKIIARLRTEAATI